VIVFNKLERDDLKKIAALMLDEIKEPLAEKGIELKYDDEALGLLADLSEGGKYGARDLRRTIRKTVEDEIATLLVDSDGDYPVAYAVSARDGKIVVDEIK